MANVYFTDKFDDDSIRKLFLAVIKEVKINKKDKTAIKVHFGEKGNTRFVNPEYIKPILAELKKLNNDHFLTDANTLYKGMRTNAKDHLKIAREHGFGRLKTKIIIADGKEGDDYKEVNIDKKIFKKVKIAKEIADSDSLIAISHFKGHALFGFGGALKNIGMGSGSRAGKLEMHSKISPSVDKEKCIGCGMCVKNCNVDAITMDERSKKANIDPKKCIGCAKCIAVCPQKAIRIPWHGASEKQVQKRCAEYAFGAVKGKKTVYFNFINNITKGCDCAKDSDIIAKDIGIMASIDPVAIDQASYDLVKKENKKDIFKKVNHVDGKMILKYAEKTGLGKRKYNLVDIDRKCRK